MDADKIRKVMEERMQGEPMKKVTLEDLNKWKNETVPDMLKNQLGKDGHEVWAIKMFCSIIDVMNDLKAEIKK